MKREKNIVLMGEVLKVLNLSYMYFSSNNVRRSPRSRNRRGVICKVVHWKCELLLPSWSDLNVWSLWKQKFMTHAAVFPLLQELSWSPSFFPLQSMVWIRSLHDLESPSNYHFKHIPHLFALRVILTVIAMYFQLCTEIPQIQGQCWKPTTNLFTFNCKVPSDHRVRGTSGTWRTSFEVRQIIEMKLWFSVISGSMKISFFFFLVSSKPGAMYHLVIDSIITPVFIHCTCHLKHRSCS